VTGLIPAHHTLRITRSLVMDSYETNYNKGIGKFIFNGVK